MSPHSVVKPNSATPVQATEPERSRLDALTIGTLALSPEFDPETVDYTVETTNVRNKVTATASDDAIILIELNGETMENGTNARWEDGENTLAVHVTEDGKEMTTYTVTVTKETV